MAKNKYFCVNLTLFKNLISLQYFSVYFIYILYISGHCLCMREQNALGESRWLQYFSWFIDLGWFLVLLTACIT